MNKEKTCNVFVAALLWLSLDTFTFLVSYKTSISCILVQEIIAAYGWYILLKKKYRCIVKNIFSLRSVLYAIMSLVWMNSDELFCEYKDMPILLVGAFIATFIIIKLFLEWFRDIIRDILENFDRIDKLYLIIGSALLSGIILLVYYTTVAFYGGNGNVDLVDILFNCDTTHILGRPVESYGGGDAFTNLNAHQNNYRGLMFSVFSLPIGILAHAISYFIPIKGIFECSLQMMQIFLALLSNILIVKLTKYKGWDKIFLLIALSSSSAFLFYCIVIERRIIGLFWAVLVLYLTMCNKGEENINIAFAGAVGCFTVNFALLPLLYQESDYKIEIKKICRVLVEIICFLSCFGRLTRIFVSHAQGYNEYKMYNGINVEVNEKIRSFFSFVANIFLFPKYEHITKGNLVYFETIQNKSFCLIGSILFLVILVSYWGMKKENRINIAIIYWNTIAVICFLIVGWTVKEKAIFLYTYFWLWSVLISIFHVLYFFVKDKKIRYLLLVLCISVILFYNAVSIFSLVRQCVYIYPQN